ncbi:carbohydrate-binding module family 13 protein [Scleroderma citrinum Foug A]|uniref:Carbohydrate-binding module family 13 protein n=1 Tax=Scleroderma citrinum Foug A TaxID=1036808 RepID=A0A0C3DHU3_9AGAM|nr:carbohydrate-binding module family 13 protein [Scleroderma citrinum Foug A]
MACIQSGAPYILLNVKAPGSCLDLSGGDNRSIIGYPPHNGPNQQWRFERLENGNYLIQSVGTGLYLRIDGEPANDVRVVAGRDRYEWYVKDEPSTPGSIRIYVPGRYINIDLSDHGNPDPGTPIALWDQWEPGQNQLWRLQQV